MPKNGTSLVLGEGKVELDGESFHLKVRRLEQGMVSRGVGLSRPVKLVFNQGSIFFIGYYNRFVKRSESVYRHSQRFKQMRGMNWRRGGVDVGGEMKELGSWRLDARSGYIVCDLKPRSAFPARTTAVSRSTLYNNLGLFLHSL